MTMLVRGGAVTGSALPATATTGQVLQWNGSAWVAATPSATGTTPNATPTVPGLVQLAGDLAGTATAPTVAKINGATPAVVATSGAYNDLTGRPTLTPVATSGAYTDLTGRPTLAAVATSGAYTDLTGRPTLTTVATSGAYTDLTGRPTLATVATSGSYGDLTGRPLLATVATSGAYTDLTGRPALVYKSADTSRASTTTQTADPDLTVPLTAGVYLVEMLVLFANTSNTQNIGYTFSGSATVAGLLTGTIGFSTGAVSYMSRAAATPINTVTAAPSGGMQVSGALTVTAAGTFGFSWAQNTTNVTAQTVQAGSWLRATKIA